MYQSDKVTTDKAVVNVLLLIIRYYQVFPLFLFHGKHRIIGYYYYPIDVHLMYYLIF